MKLVSWNMKHSPHAWHHLIGSGLDVALLQEACEPPADVLEHIQIDGEAWRTEGNVKRAWRTAIVGLSDRVSIEWLEPRSIAEAGSREFAVSRRGTLSA